MTEEVEGPAGHGREAPAPWAPLEPEAPASPAPQPTPAQPWPPVVPAAPGADAGRGPLPVRPMTLSDILDGAFKLFKENARTVILVAAVFLVPVGIASAFLARHATVNFGSLFSRNAGTDRTSIELPVASYLVTLADYVFIRPLVAGAVSFVVAESYLGRHTDPGQALRVAARRSPALIIASFVTHLLATMGFVFCIVPGVLLVGLLAGVAPAIVVDGTGPFAGIRRSGALFRPRMFRTAGIVLLALLMATALGN